MGTEDVVQEKRGVEFAELTLEVAQLWPSQGQWTEVDYFALPNANRFLELSEGVLVMPPHPTHTHQRIVGNLYRALYDFVVAHGLGIVQLGPLPVRLWPGKIREPDILFLTGEHGDRLDEQVYGPPDLAVEVLSPSTRRLDRLEKMVEYARAGVPEYWMVDPAGQTAEVFTWCEGAYELLGKWGRGEVLCSKLIVEFKMTVDEVLE